MGKLICRNIEILLLLFSAAIAGEQEKKIPTTFLDTLNKGREVAISNADIIPQTVPVTVSVQAPVPADTVSAVLPAVPKRDAGAVPSRFKIQILASTQEQQVKREKNALAAKTSLPISISFDVPYYKLFAGDFAQRGEAENYCTQFKKMGYNDAWIVRTAAVPQKQ